MSPYDEDKELLDRIRTREELEKRGYKRRRCEHCHGAGVLGGDEQHDCLPTDCHACRGRGYTWESPMY